MNTTITLTSETENINITATLFTAHPSQRAYVKWEGTVNLLNNRPEIRCTNSATLQTFCENIARTHGLICSVKREGQWLL